MKLPSLRRGKAALAALMAAVLAALGFAAFPLLATTASAATPTTVTNGQFSVNISDTTALVAGQSITLNVTASGGAHFTGVKTHICKTSIPLPVDQFNFGFNSYCSPVAPRGGDFEVNDTFATVTSGTSTFKAGTSTVNWNSQFDNSAQSLTCDSANPCMLVTEVQSPDTAPNTFYFAQQLTYSQVNPGAPTIGVTTPGAPGSGQATVHWTAPTNPGDGSITNYVVHDVANVLPDVTVAGNQTSALVSGLSIFTNYQWNVHAVSTTGTGTNSGNSAAIQVSPSLPGTPIAAFNGTGSHAVTLTWATPGGGGTVDDYLVKVYTEPGHTQAGVTIDTGSASSNTGFVVGPSNFNNPNGLVDGTQYSFTVIAHYSAPSSALGAESAQSNTIAPYSALVTQTIDATRPNGALVLTEDCTNSRASVTAPLAGGAVDPTQPNYPNYVQGGQFFNCNVSLGTAHILTSGPNAGNFFQATGALKQLTVLDTRDTNPNPNWVAGAQMISPFDDGASHQFSPNDLGVAPVITSHSAPFDSPDAGTYTMNPVAGTASIAADTVNGVGHPKLAAGMTLASAAAGSNLGIALIDAQLNLMIPVFIHSGHYTGVMQITIV